jgi:hypothetical protein
MRRVQGTKVRAHISTWNAGRASNREHGPEQAAETTAGYSGVDREERCAYGLKEKYRRLAKLCGAITAARNSPSRPLDGADVHAAIR